MSDLKHTPGPWSMESPRGRHGVWIGCANGRSWRRTALAGGDTDDEANANARLIAAAPQLLEALRGVLADAQVAQVLIRCGAIPDSAREGLAEEIQTRIETAFTAIAAATGES